jgi:DNA-binding ferritin-like protein
MALKSLFPEEMVKSSGGEMSLENVAAKLTYFHEQLHLLHWKTTSYAEHQALGGIYDYVHDFKDGVIEKLMGYTGKRPKAFKVEPLSDSASASIVVGELMSFASSLKSYAESNGYHDISNLADALSGEAAKVRYLLTLS